MTLMPLKPTNSVLAMTTCWNVGRWFVLGGVARRRSLRRKEHPLHRYMKTPSLLQAVLIDTIQEEDLHALLVKAWETKVFPVIQRRFRNDQERKSGLEQIKGALQLGMEGIAQETVEFLYEENGGIPKDLHLPTMDDVKADLGKFTISKVWIYM